MSIGENYLEIVERKNRAAVRSGRNPEDVLLLAVTKLHTVGYFGRGNGRRRESGSGTPGEVRPHGRAGALAPDRSSADQQSEEYYR